MAQRLTALIMALLTIGHLAVMIYAVQDGLNVAEISRAFRSLAAFILWRFVVAVSIHAAIGMRVILFEWLGIKGAVLSALAGVYACCCWGWGARCLGRNICRSRHMIRQHHHMRCGTLLYCTGGRHCIGIISAGTFLHARLSLDRPGPT